MVSLPDMIYFFFLQFSHYQIVSSIMPLSKLSLPSYFYFSWAYQNYASFTYLLVITKFAIELQGPPKNLLRSIYPISSIVHPNQTLS